MIDPTRFASWVSAEARAAAALAPSPPPLTADIGELRVHYDAYNRRLLEVALAAYAVTIDERTFADVPVQIVKPAGKIRSEAVLLCLHGGAFMWGAGAGALLEAVPLAAEIGCEVIAVDYRLAPEHTFPAAVEDVLAAYTEILGRCVAGNVGIYGCSAGAMLTAQTVSRIVRDGLPVPGAIAMLHGAGLDFAGDLASTAAAFARPAQDGETPDAGQLPYFATADLADPLVMPGDHPETLARFPPSLLVSATRDFAASACSVMHRRLLAAGIDAQFVLFDGLGHAHHMAVDLPESRETFGLMRRFFGAHLRP